MLASARVPRCWHRRTANGFNALAVRNGSGNTAMGFGALALNTTGHGNTALGDGAGNNVTTASTVICPHSRSCWPKKFAIG